MDIVVQHAELIPGMGPHGVWKISADVTVDGKTDQTGWFMPYETIEWRVAQFNVDAKTALEMVLVEPYMKDLLNEELEMQPTRSQARQMKLEGMQAALAGGSITWAVGPPTWTASGGGAQSDAIVDSGDGDPLQTILEATPVSDETVAVRREALDRIRARVRRRVARRRQMREEQAVELRRRKAPQPPTVEELRTRLRLEPMDPPEPSGPQRRRSDGP